MAEIQHKGKIDNKDHIKLAENEVLDKAKEELTNIQENLSEKKMTVEQARAELEREYEKIDKWIKGTNLEQHEKKEFGKAFEKFKFKFNKLKENIDEVALNNEVNEVIKLLETVTKKDLANLKNSIVKPHEIGRNTRPVDVQKGIEQSSEDLTSTINDASQDTNPIAKKIGERMKKLIS